MTKQISEIKTPADMIAYCHELFGVQITALNGLLDKVPADLKGEYLAMRDKMNALLKRLPPLEQVPAAQEGAWALNSFARTITDLFDYMDVFRERISGMTTALATQTTALNGLQERVTKGELVDKTSAATAMQTAIDHAIKPFQAEIATMRQTQVALCKLPDCPAEILGLPTDQFTAALDLAKTQLAVCEKRGFAVGGKGDAFIKLNVWTPATSFQGANQTLEDLADTLKLRVPGGDPFLGGTGKKPEDAGQTRKHTLA